MSTELLGRAYREVSRPPSRRACPQSGQLVDLAAGALHDPTLADHLGNCTACAEEYLALRSVAPSAGRTAPRHLSPAWPLAMAALLMLTVGLGAVAWSLLERNRDLMRVATQPVVRGSSPPAAAQTPVQPPLAAVPPQPNVSIIDLLPASAMVRSGGTARAAAPQDSADLTLILNLDGAATFPDYSLDFVDGRGHVAWSGRGLKRSPNETFTLHLTRDFLRPERYELRLYGVRGEQRTPIERYALDLRPGSK